MSVAAFYAVSAAEAHYSVTLFAVFSGETEGVNSYRPVQTEIENSRRQDAFIANASHELKTHL